MVAKVNLLILQSLRLASNQNQESNQYWVCGISFGAWVGMQLLMRRPEIPKFVLISPPVGKYDFNFLAPCPASGLVISAEKDNLVDKVPFQMQLKT